MLFIKKLIFKILLQSIGKAYDGSKLSRKRVAAAPILLFSEWFQQMLKESPDRANIMSLATVSPEGKPSSRLVLLKYFDEQGFIFYSNYRSRKALEMKANSKACLNFFWDTSLRQVRIEGVVEKISSQESDAYFQKRARGSQLGAWASPQSQIIQDRKSLEEKVAEITEKYKGRDVPRPPFWGGYRLIPDEIEFWQGRLDRLHDRFRYTKKTDGNWSIDRLAP